MPRIVKQPRPIDLKDPPPFATVGETQETLRTSRATVYRMIADGRLEAIKIGACTRVKIDSLRQLIQAAPSL